MLQKFYQIEENAQLSSSDAFNRISRNTLEDQDTAICSGKQRCLKN